MWTHSHTHPNTHDRISMIYWTIRPRFSTRPFKIKTSAYKTKLFELKRRDCLFWCLIFTWPRKLSALAVHVSSFQSCFSFNLLCCPDPIDYLLLLWAHSFEYTDTPECQQQIQCMNFSLKSLRCRRGLFYNELQHATLKIYRIPNSNFSSRLPSPKSTHRYLFEAYEQ